MTYSIGLAEGIESALSLTHAHTPVWATVDAGNLSTLPVLAGIETVVLNQKEFGSREEFDKAAVSELKKRDIGLVVLAGYMRILTPYFINAYSGKILNIHPSLLPLFKGTDGIGDALKAGVSETGVTVHFVTEELDAGPIILQQKVPVSADETKEALAKKIHALEHKLYPEAIRYFIEGRLKVDGDKVVISEK